MSQTKIAVAIPTFRRPELLLQLTRSIPVEISVSVSDNAGSMVGQNLQFGSNVAIHHADRSLPIFANWNRAVAFIPADATHVLIPSDDDLYLPGAMRTVNEAVAKYPDADMLVFGCDFVDEHGTTRPGWRPEREEACEAGDGFLPFETGVDARMPGVLFKTEFLRRIGGFDERFELTAADSELIQRASLLGRSVFIPTVIGLYRIWTGSLTHARQATDLWVNEIELWTGKIAALLQAGHQPLAAQVDIERYRGEILARNLLAGAAGLVARGERSKAREFLCRYRTPRKTALRTRLSLLRMRWGLWSLAR